MIFDGTVMGMGGTKSSEKPSFKLKLLVDKKKNKVVLAEASKDFVDVLFSFLTFPMGTIVRLVEKKYQQNQKSQATTIGCFNNLYKSVDYLGTSSFMTEACKDMLLYPRSVIKKENQRRGLLLTIDDREIDKYYVCPKVDSTSTCPKAFSDFCSSRCCFCGALMDKAFIRLQKVECDELFVSDKTLFSVTDDLRVGVASMGLILKTLQGLGYSDVNQLHEMVVDVDHEKVLALLRCLFSSDTPLSDVFLMKNCSCGVINTRNKPNIPIYGGEEAGSNEVLSISVFTRNLDRKVLYVESGKDFVDLLFTFLALPLNSAWEISGSNIALGCIGKLCESFRRLSSSKAMACVCWLPWYYKCQRPLLDVRYKERETDRLVNIKSQTCYLKAMDPRCDKNVESGMCSGFVKREMSFIVSDDLIIAPMDLSSTIFSFKKWDMDLDDIEEQVINISKAEAIRLLKASFMTSTALTTAFGSLLTKKPKD